MPGFACRIDGCANRSFRRPPMNICGACRPSWRGLHNAGRNSLNVKDKLGAADCMKTPDRPKWLTQAIAKTKRRLCKKTRMGGSDNCGADVHVKSPVKVVDEPKGSQCVVDQSISKTQDDHVCARIGSADASHELQPVTEFEEMLVAGLELGYPGHVKCSVKEAPWKCHLSDMIFDKLSCIKSMASRTDATFIVGAALNLLNQSAECGWKLAGPPPDVPHEILAAAFLNCAVAIQTPPQGYECSPLLALKLQLNADRKSGPETVAEYLQMCIRCIPGRSCVRDVARAEWLVMSSVFGSK